MHQDVIMSCIDDPDISIRLQALHLGAGMVNATNITSVVDRLMAQLREPPLEGRKDNLLTQAGNQVIEPTADGDNEDPEETLRPEKSDPNDTTPLPDEYRVTVIRQILDMCSRDTYANIDDFEWYIDILVKLAVVVPSNSRTNINGHGSLAIEANDDDIATAVGAELRNVAVRVASVRAQAVRAASLLLTPETWQSRFPSVASGHEYVLAFAAWVVGEYSSMLPDRHQILDVLLLHSPQASSPTILCAYLQAIPKVLASIFLAETMEWNIQRQTMTSLLIARVLHFLVPLTTDPNLEVQERSVELLELMRLSAEAVTGHELEDSYGPLILSKALPALFDGLEMKPVALSAQSKVPIPENIDLAAPLNGELFSLLREADKDTIERPEIAEMEKLYHTRSTFTMSEAASDLIPSITPATLYQDMERYLDPEYGPNNERQEKNRNDPFYIPTYQADPSRVTASHRDIIQATNGQELDVEAIPIMNLDLGRKTSDITPPDSQGTNLKHRQRQQVQVVAEETVDAEDQKSEQQPMSLGGRARLGRDKIHRGLLQLDSSGIGDFILDTEGKGHPQEEGDMIEALAEVEKLRIEMRRASERVRVPEDIPLDGTLIKKKKKVKKNSRESVLAQERTREDESDLASSIIIGPKKKTKGKKIKKQFSQGEPAME